MLELNVLAGQGVLAVVRVSDCVSVLGMVHAGCARSDGVLGAGLVCVLGVVCRTDAGDWGPTTDGVTIPHDPMTMLKQGTLTTPWLSSN